MIQNKKAISAVVATIMIVLVAIIAVMILWAALRKPIESGAEGAGTATECFYLDLKIEDVNYDGSQLGVKVKRNAGAAELNTVRIIVDGTEKIPTDATGPNELETKTYNMSVSSKPTDKVEIAGVLKGGNTCSVSDTYLADDITTI